MLEIVGYHNKDILFRFNGKKYALPKSLPKNDLMLLFGIRDEDVKAEKARILLEAHTKPLTYIQLENFWRDKYDNNNQISKL